MSATNRKRPLQVASVIKKELVEVICRLGLSNITISGVKMSPDLRYANVFFVSKDIKSSDLQGIAPLIKNRMSKKVYLKRMPNLHFIIDETFDTFSKIDALLKTLQ